MTIKPYHSFLLLLILLSLMSAHAQDVSIPQGVNYKKTTDKINTKAQELMTTELQGDCNYKIFSGSLIIGPRLWERFSKIDSLKNIQAGNTTFHIPQLDDHGKPKGMTTATGKLIQTKEDYRLLWGYIRADFKGANLKYRKLNPTEISYYWSIISFDIDEPLFIVENGKYKMLVNILPTTLKIFWLDEVY